MADNTQAANYDYQTVKVTFDEGVAWVSLNRPDKRNAMSPTLNVEMLEVLERLEFDDRCEVLVLTGEGEAFSAGMDLKQYFRETDHESAQFKAKVRAAAAAWQWRKLRFYPKPTIAMVNGWCFGGAFAPLVACDLAIAADEAQLGLSEINWGIIPGGNVTKAMMDVCGERAAMYYIMTGKPFDGRKAAEIGLVNESVPLVQLRETTRQLAQLLRTKNPTVLRSAKHAARRVVSMDWDLSEEYLAAKAAQTQLNDPEKGRAQGLKQFLDEKTIRPGLEGYKRDA
ncbi:MAG: p-hydroxycinnamoyl CoA hydratase/lyase [Sphingobium sp.]|nr:MAG: p-hydroxycinnamoyl CoA hydratase/lyase [Sphingobium sp.]